MIFRPYQPDSLLRKINGKKKTCFLIFIRTIFFILIKNQQIDFIVYLEIIIFILPFFLILK